LFPEGIGVLFRVYAMQRSERMQMAIVTQLALNPFDSYPSFHSFLVRILLRYVFRSHHSSGDHHSEQLDIR